VCQKSDFVIAIRVAGSNPEARKPLDCFTPPGVRDDENRSRVSAGIRGTPSEIRLLTRPRDSFRDGSNPLGNNAASREIFFLIFNYLE
jgi:hypothetical protein